MLPGSLRFLNFLPSQKPSTKATLTGTSVMPLSNACNATTTQLTLNGMLVAVTRCYPGDVSACVCHRQSLWYGQGACTQRAEAKCSLLSSLAHTQYVTRYVVINVIKLCATWFKARILPPNMLQGKFLQTAGK